MIHREENPKHKPYVEINKIEEGSYEIYVEVGKEVKHPNQPDHSIEWVEIFFQEEGKEPMEIARVDFKAHGVNEIYTEPKVKIYFRTNKKGKIIVLAYCTIHGIWVTEKEI